jgi:hypothetical protein
MLYEVHTIPGGSRALTHVCVHYTDFFTRLSAIPEPPGRDWKIIATDTVYQIPTVLYRTITVFSHKPSNRLPIGRK